METVRDLETVWRYQEKTVEDIIASIRGSDSLGHEEYMAFYAMTGSLKESCPDIESVDQSDHFRLLNLLQMCFARHLKTVGSEISRLEDREFLHMYAKEWATYVANAEFLDGLYKNLNVRFKAEFCDGVKELCLDCTVYIVAIDQWRDVIVSPIRFRLLRVSNTLIENQKTADALDLTSLKLLFESAACMNYVKLFLEDKCRMENTSFRLDSHDGTPVDKILVGTSRQYRLCDVENYETGVVTPFLHWAKTSLAATAKTLAMENSLLPYLEKASELMTVEKKSVRRHLLATTHARIVDQTRQVLFHGYTKVIGEYFRVLLDNDNEDNMRRMHSSLTDVPVALAVMLERFEVHVAGVGRAMVERFVESGSDHNDDSNLHPTRYLHTLCEMHAMFLGKIGRVFNGDKGFVVSLDRAFRVIVNRNAYTGSSPTKTVETLASRADTVLRKNGLTKGESLELVLNQVVFLITFIEDKDVFQTLYTTKLSMRLIHGVSVSDEAEANMISRLKGACGFEYTNKIQRMFTDMSLSKDLTSRFKEKMKVSHPDDSNLTFTIMVLGTNLWPLSAPSTDFIVPKDILPTYNRFQQYYHSKHSERKLTWLWHYSKNELRTNYTDRRYILMTSSYQMAVLVLYNDYVSLTLEEIVNHTAISQDILKQVLAVLTKAKILLQDKEDGPYDLNPNFKSKSIRINLNHPILPESKVEATEKVLQTVDDDRQYAIQATIVRYDYVLLVISF